MFEWLIHSMKAIYNSRITEEENIQISANNRGFCYGDGLFETIVTGTQRINLIPQHLDRLMRHSERLGIQLSKTTLQELPERVEALRQLNNIEGDCRTKIMVWRKSGGLYAPTEQNGEVLITQKKTSKPLVNCAATIGISNDVQNHYWKYAGIKPLNALHYVMAGQEMLRKELDEIILLDQRGFLSETHLGNLFWLKDDRLYTPALTTGCVEGVMRSFIINFYQDIGSPVEIVEEKPDALDEANSMFSTNASGITWFEGYKRSLSDPTLFLEELIKRLQQP